MDYKTKRLQQKGVVELVLVVLVLFVGIFVFLIINNRPPSTLEANSPSTTPTHVFSPTISPTPTEVPFKEMTIPYLRARNYNSSLGQLTQVYERENFTAYLTSYNSDGLNINGLLTVPKGDSLEDGWPAVVFVHGYIPPEQYRTLEKYEDYVNYLANRGLVVFKIDLRGHGSSEGIPFGAYYAGEYIIDTLNAHAALKNSDFVDPERIGLWGHSMAGNVVFRSFVAQQEIEKVVIWAGAVYTYEDFQEYRISDNSYRPPMEDSERQKRREELFNTHGDFSAEHPFWRQIVPTNYLEDVTGFVQVHHAINDNVVDIRYSRNLMQVLEDTNIDHQLFEYISGGHNINGSSFTQAMQKTADFYLQ